MRLKPKNNSYKSRIEAHLERQNFMHHLGISLVKIEAGRTEAEMLLDAIHLQQDGFAHGGVIATIADIVAGFAAYSLVGEEQHVVTGEIKISYFSKGEGDLIRAKGWVIKPGKRLHFCEAEVFVVKGDTETLIAKATTTMVVI